MAASTSRRICHRRTYFLTCSSPSWPSADSGSVHPREIFPFLSFLCHTTALPLPYNIIAASRQVTCFVYTCWPIWQISMTVKNACWKNLVSRVHIAGINQIFFSLCRLKPGGSLIAGIGFLRIGVKPSWGSGLKWHLERVPNTKGLNPPSEPFWQLRRHMTLKRVCQVNRKKKKKRF